MLMPTWFLAGFLLGAPPTPAEAWPAPKLEKGLEIIWRGSFSEATLRPNVRAFRPYDVETRAFVLDVWNGQADVALFTVLRLRPDPKPPVEPPPIVRLELLRIDATGKAQALSAEAMNLPVEERKPTPRPLLTLEGIPNVEPSLFLAGPAKAAKTWETAEEKRPPVKFRDEGIDNVRGARTIRILALQQTDDWESLRIERPAWRRGELIWISAQHGWALRCERTIEKRDPRSGELAFRSKLALEQAGRMLYTGRLAQDRREEIAAAALFMHQFDQLLNEGTGNGPRSFEGLLKEIDQHVINHFTSESLPYREAVLMIKRKAEAARKGHLPPTPLPPETGEANGTLTPGKAAADIAPIDLATSETIRLSKLRGRPVVLIYYQPGSARTAEPVLRFAQTLYTRHGQQAFILPLAIGGADAAAQLRNDLRLTVPLLNGAGCYQAHRIESTPYFAILDAKGVVRKVVSGWSSENTEAVREELERLVSGPRE